MFAVDKRTGPAQSGGGGGSEEHMKIQDRVLTLEGLSVPSKNGQEP